jgi:hypothetical protein
VVDGPGLQVSDPRNLVERRFAELTTRWFTAPEAVAYDMAGEVIRGPAGVPESGTPA